RGILDLDHTRLFTFASLRRVLQNTGFEIVEERGIPAPFPLALGDTRFARLILKANMLLIRLSRTLFAYQIAFVVKAKPTLENLLENAIYSSAKKLDQARS